MAKKDIELNWLERAREIRPELFRGDLTATESPDFVLVHEARVLGVELTRFVYSRREGEPIPEEQAGLRQRLLAWARDEYAQTSATKLRVGVVFKPDLVLSAARTRDLATRLASWLSANMRGAPEMVQRRWTESIPAEFASVYATVVPSAANAHWYPAEAGWATSADAQAVAGVVAAKEGRIPEYRTRCEEIARLIVFDGAPRWSRILHAPDDPPGFSVPSAFDFVYCLDIFEKRLVEIPLQRAV